MVYSTIGWKAAIPLQRTCKIRVICKDTLNLHIMLWNLYIHISILILINKDVPACEWVCVLTFSCTIQVLLAVVAFFGAHSSQAAGPHLLVSKIILNEYIVEAKDLTIQYSLYNVGEGWALIGT